MESLSKVVSIGLPIAIIIAIAAIGFAAYTMYKKK